MTRVARSKGLGPWRALVAVAGLVATPLFAADAPLPPPSWPAAAKPPAQAPSVVLVMTDDVGFGTSSTFGGPVETPTLDRLARTGIRYNMMHTTGICSPTRAALLTGRDHTAVGIGNVVDAATGFEGYASVMPRSAATVARVLRDAGYSTAMFGKSHMVPAWESGPAGPFDQWPTGLGFQHFYGFLGGDTNQFAPALYWDTQPIDPARDRPDYILDQDLADRAITWMRQQQAAAPGKPLFIYFAPGTAHAPHNAPREWGSIVTGAASTRVGTSNAGRRWRARRSWVSSRRARSWPSVSSRFPPGRRSRRSSDASMRVRWRCSRARCRSRTTRSVASSTKRDACWARTCSSSTCRETMVRVPKPGSTELSTSTACSMASMLRSTRWSDGSTRWAVPSPMATFPSAGPAP